MPSSSENQRRAMAIALAAKRGKFPPSKLGGPSQQMYKGMTANQLSDFAKKPSRGFYGTQ